MTVLDLVTASLQRIGVLAVGETANASDSAIGLSALNLLIDGWATESLPAYTITRSTFTITSGTGTYAVGTGSVVNIARPVRNNIQRVNFQDTSITPTLEYQCQPLTDDAYSMIPQKSLTSRYPTSWYYNPTYPTGTLTFWPVPTSTSLQGVIYVITAVPEFSALADTVALPPGYRRMYETNLALELLQYFPERGVPETLPSAAMEAKDDVKRGNVRLMDMPVDPASLVQGWPYTFNWSILSGP